MNNGTTSNKNMQELNMMGIHIYYETINQRNQNLFVWFQQGNLKPM